MNYSLQVVTDNADLKRKTEVEGISINGLQFGFNEMVQRYPEVIGKPYHIFKMHGMGDHEYYKTRWVRKECSSGIILDSLTKLI